MRYVVLRRACVLLLSGVVASVSASPFNILSSKKVDGILPEVHPNIEARQVDWALEDKVKSRGWLSGNVDMNIRPEPDWLWPLKPTEPRLDFIVSRGELRGQAVAVRALNDLNSLKMKWGELVSSSGTVFPDAHKDIRMVEYTSFTDSRTKNLRWGVDLLRASSAVRVPEGVSAWYWISIHAPTDIASGIYSGYIVLSDENNKQEEIPVRVRVLDRDFAYPEGSWGLYMPGHFLGKTNQRYGNFASEYLIPENIETYFGFWKTRGLNSPNLFHIYPELSYNEGKVNATFSHLEGFVDAYKAVGFNGKLSIDTRHISWWANVVGKVLDQAEKEGKPVPSSVNLGGERGVWEQSAGAYSERTKDIYRQVIVLLEEYLKKAEMTDNVVMFAEEEIGNSADKTAGYDAFTPVLRELIGDRLYVLDNSIGYGRHDEVDRGHRDRIKLRQYNNWTVAAQENARNFDGAVLWNFNMGWERGMWGQYAYRSNVFGNHQWADHWVGSLHSWVYTRIDNTGVVSSFLFETVQEGLADLSYIRELQGLVAELERNGNAELAGELNAILTTLDEAIPLNKLDAEQYLRNYSDLDFEVFRWDVILAIERAKKSLGKEHFEITSESSGAPRIFQVNDIVTERVTVESDYLLEAPYLDEGFPEDTGKNNTGQLTWLGERMVDFTARAGDSDELSNIPMPTQGNALIGFSREGIHMVLSSKVMVPDESNKQNDDPSLWTVDGWDIVIVPDGGKGAVLQYQISSIGSRTLRQNRQVVSSDAVVRVERPSRKDGLIRHYVTFPWSDFGLNKAPEIGETWKFNVGRMLPSIRWEKATWSPIYRRYDIEPENLGYLRFGGATGSVAFNSLETGPMGIGRNFLSGVLAAKHDNQNVGSLRVELITGGGNVVAHSRSDEKGMFSIPYRLYPVQAGVESYSARIQVLDARYRRLASLPIQIPVQQSSILLNSPPEAIIAGSQNFLEGLFAVGNAEDKLTLTAVFMNEKEDVIRSEPIAVSRGGMKSMLLETRGVPSGEWILRLELKGEGLDIQDTVLPIRVLPDPFGDGDSN